MKQPSTVLPQAEQPSAELPGAEQPARVTRGEAAINSVTWGRAVSKKVTRGQTHGTVLSIVDILPIPVPLSQAALSGLTFFSLGQKDVCSQAE